MGRARQPSIDSLHLAACRTTAAVKDLGNANTNTPLYSPLPFHVLGNGAGFFPQLQVSNLCKALSALGGQLVCGCCNHALQIRFQEESVQLVLTAVAELHGSSAEPVSHMQTMPAGRIFESLTTCACAGSLHVP